jgi:hypothetical protein
MNRLPILAAALFTACAHAQGAKPAANIDVKTALEPKKVHEECATLQAGETRKYQWKADVAVDFNIHYHKGKDVFYPVKRDMARGHNGTFKAKAAEDYCWMWTARDVAANIQGTITK